MEKPSFYLAEINSVNKLRELFIEKWNWELPKIPKPHFSFPLELKNEITCSLILSERDQFKVLFFEIDDLSSPERKLKSFERKTVHFLTRGKELDIENCVFVFAANNFNYLDFLKAEKIGGNIRLKRFFICPENRNKLRTACEQLEKLNLAEGKLDFSDIKNKIEEAFSVEAVTEKFYESYIEIFNEIKKTLIKQNVQASGKEKEGRVRNFIHQTLNRLMFLYFVQKRGSFGQDQNFLANFWEAYKANSGGKDEFHQKWLNVLFFESLSQPSWLYKEKAYLEEFNEILKNAPYLNGGLFQENELDKIGWIIPDELFDDIFEFFESYNFTIEESTPFDIEIAINPEMLGNIYEHLVNVEEREEQARAGIFYTPKVEIELMIKRSLVEFLFKKTGMDKERLYKFVFPEFGEQIQDPFTLQEAQKILKELDEIFILDPACGSGHYLVVALQILYQLKEPLWKELNYPHLGKYEEKKKIINKNLYGNDIKEWAIEVAKLRLWLDLFVDAEDEILKNQIEPLLPNLNFKIRCGDGLVQRLGNNILPLRKIKSFMKSREDDLKFLVQKKKHVYETSGEKEYRETLYLEKKLLINALEEYEIKIQKEVQKINFQLKNDLLRGTLFGIRSKEKERQELELKEITKLKEELSKQKEAPMLWDLAFAEVFQIKNGFDIVIANPPYVRQERIEDLIGFYSKKEYKEKLIEQMFRDWSYNFEGKPCKAPFTPSNFDKKADLYVYFYLKGLKLLNPDGILCYISSNSWLDVGYGTKIQEILLKRVPIIAIYDNLAKRSFKHADINTIIALMKAPKDEDFDEEIKTNDVRFVNFKKPFEEIMYSEIFIDLEKNENLKEYPEGKRRETEIYRLHLVNQRDLYEYGRKESTGKRLIGSQREGEYIGNKWGGKYLRAPEIYWKILGKGKGKLVRLGDIAEVKAGIITGNNKKYYKRYEGQIFDKNEYEKVFKSPKDVRKIKIKSEDAKWLIKKENRFLNKRANILTGDTKDNIFIFHLNLDNLLFEHKFIGINYKNNLDLCYILNSTLTILCIELFGRSTLGEGALYLVPFDLKILEILNPISVKIKKTSFLENFLEREIHSIFTELGFDPKKPIRDQEPNPLPDRKALDDIVFDALGLTEKERKEVYWAVAELVKNRLEKARSV